MRISEAEQRLGEARIKLHSLSRTLLGQSDETLGSFRACAEEAISLVDASLGAMGRANRGIRFIDEVKF